MASLRVIEREAAALQAMIKESTDLKEHLKHKEIEHEEFILRHEVRVQECTPYVRRVLTTAYSDWRNK